jgi:hypothetical protein
VLPLLPLNPNVSVSHLPVWPADPFSSFELNMNDAPLFRDGVVPWVSITDLFVLYALIQPDPDICNAFNLFVP